MSSAISVNELLAGYLSGRVSAEQLVKAVSAEYYRETRNGKRETWRPIIDVIERAHPGVVELKSVADGPGFDVRLLERPFPKRYEPELRQAVASVLHTFPVSRSTFPEKSRRGLGLLQRIVRAVRNLFNA